MSNTKFQAKIAIVYDRATTEYGGAEYLLKLIAQAFPEADLYSPIIDKRLSWVKKYKKQFYSWMNKLPASRKLSRFLFPFYPFAMESFDFSRYQVIVSISSGEAKGVVTRADQFHLAYLFTPPRYLYQLKERYPGANHWLSKPLLKQLLAPVWRYLRWWDLAAAARADRFATLSAAAARQIKQQYQLDAEIVYPPARDLRSALADFQAKKKPGQPYLLAVGRMVEYKRFDLAIETVLLSRRKLILVGSGPELNSLRTLAGNAGWLRPADMSLEFALESSGFLQAQIAFLGNVVPAELAWLYTHALLVLSPGVDDFGLVPLEAGLFGVSSVINAKSGVAEILKPPLAAHLSLETVSGLEKAINRQISFSNKQLLIARATQLSSASFLERIQQLVYDGWREKQ